jgi:NADPH:quinone reductase-like Zn-dependent oxidoreductase
MIWREYGSPQVLQLQEVPKPLPKDYEVLIRICATTVTAGDCEQRSLKLPFWQRLPMRAYVGLKKPTRIRILGMDLSGEIEAAGKAVKRYREGDQVFGTTGFVNMGTYAEYICLPEEPEEGALALKPANMTYQQAAAVPTGGLEALSFLRKGAVQGGEKVLINGAGGTIGTFAVQLARYFGAEVTGVESTDKLDMLRSLGADQLVDYTREDFTNRGETYDLILDVVGKSSFSGSLRSLKRNGCYLIANPSLSQMIRGRWASLTSSKRVIFGAASPKSQDLLFLKELIEAGKLIAVIDRCYPLEQVPEAHRYVERGSKRGNVVITVKDHGNQLEVSAQTLGSVV